MWNTVSLYTRRRSFTTSSVSSERVISLAAQFGGGRRGAIFIPGLPFSPLMSMEATLKFPPHWLQILLPRHFLSSTSSLSFKLITKSMSVTPSSISYRKEWISWHQLKLTKWSNCVIYEVFYINRVGILTSGFDNYKWSNCVISEVYYINSVETLTSGFDKYIAKDNNAKSTYQNGRKYYPQIKYCCREK